VSSTTTKTTTQKVDWSLAPRGAVSGTALAALGLVALGGAGDLAHINPVFAGLGAGVGALSHVMASAAQAKYTPGAIVYRLACWAGAGSWLTWAWHTPTSHGHHLHAFGHQGLAALAVGAVGAGIAAPIGRHTRKTTPAPADGKPGTELARVIGPVGQAWEARFRRVCNVKVQVTEVIRWDNGSGYDVVGVLPPGPATRDKIAAMCDALATDARLPDGCGCESKPPRPGSHRGEIVLAVSTVNRFGNRGDDEPPKIPYPADYSPRSILQPIAQGEYRDGTLATIRLREDSKLITGRKGGGKTNDLDVDTLGVGRCRDALVWHIDLNGGGMSQFWLDPWLNGQTDRPMIDWAAPNPEEALYMVTLAVAIAKGRKTAYRAFKAKANSKLLPVSAQLPEIVVMMDEGAEALKPTNTDPVIRQIREGLEEIQRIGRNEAVNVIISSLRPVSSCISPDLLNQSAIRVGTFGLSAADLGHLYDWQHRGISAADLPVKGTSFLGVMPDVPRPKKSWYLEPDQIKEAAVAIAGYRPDLDQASADIANAGHTFIRGGKSQILNDLYTTRYGRMRAAFTGQHDNDDQQTNTTPAQPTTPPAGTAVAQRPPVQLTRPTPAQVTRAADWADPFDVGHTTTAAPAASSAADWPNPFDVGRQLTPATTTPEQAQPVPEELQQAIAVIKATGDDRMHSKTLTAELGLPNQMALAKLMRGFGIKSRPKFKRNGEDLRGYWLEDMTAVADRIARGEAVTPITDDAAEEDPDE